MVSYLKQALALLVAVAVIALLAWRLISLRIEMSELQHRHEGNVRALTEEVERYKVRDSISVATAAALELRASEAARTIDGLKRQLAELDIRLKDVRSVTTTEVLTRDTVYIPQVVETTAKGDTCRSYSDGWLSLSLCDGADGSMVTYAVRDSLTSYVHVRYLRRFLWWRWRPQYRVTVMSHNPRSEVLSTSSVFITE